MIRHSGAYTFFALVFFLVTSRLPVQAQTPDPLEPVASLVGGRWFGDGTWPGGSALRVEQRYFWGPTRRVLHFETYDLSAGERTLLYEGLLFFDPKRSKIIQKNFKPTGDVDEIEMTRFDASGYEVKGEKTWSLIRYINPNEFSWELRIPQNGAWKSILNARYLRKE